MPAQIVVVHDDAAFKSAAVQALRAEGYSVASFPDALAATAALAMASRIELLITRLQFAEGRSNGVALALMTRTRKPGVKVIFTGRPEMREHTSDIGLFLEMPIALDDLAPSGRNFLRASQKGIVTLRKWPIGTGERGGSLLEHTDPGLHSTFWPSTVAPMPAQIVVVHDDPAFQVAVVLALQAEGYSVAAYEDALAAMVDLENASRIELLITRLRFADGRSNGRALALMAKSRRPSLKVIFTSSRPMKSYTEDIGRFLEMPVPIPDLMEAVREELS